jgi:hypothetical protein
MRNWLEYRKERRRLLNFLKEHGEEEFTEMELEQLGFRFLGRLLRRPFFAPLSPFDGEFPISPIGFHTHDNPLGFDEKVYFYRRGRNAGKTKETKILCKCGGRMLSVRKILTNEIIGYKCVKCQNLEMLT